MVNKVFGLKFTQNKQTMTLVDPSQAKPSQAKSTQAKSNQGKLNHNINFTMSQLIVLYYGFSSTQ